eukprot:8779441-Prorocentrum_lima.AAC.1
MTLPAILKKHYGDDAEVEVRKFEHTGIRHEQDHILRMCTHPKSTTCWNLARLTPQMLTPPTPR